MHDFGFPHASTMAAIGFQMRLLRSWQANEREAALKQDLAILRRRCDAERGQARESGAMGFAAHALYRGLVWEIERKGEAAGYRSLAPDARARLGNWARSCSPIPAGAGSRRMRRLLPGSQRRRSWPNTTGPPPCPVRRPGRSTRSMAWPNSNCARTAWQSRRRILPGSSARWQDPPSITTRRRGSRNPAPWRPAPLPRPARPGFASRHFAGPHILVVLK